MVCESVCPLVWLGWAGDGLAVSLQDYGITPGQCQGL
jgi:hypothetical protein